MTDTVLILSVGESDIQAVVANKRVPLASDGLRKLHEQLLAGPYQVVAPPKQKEGRLDVWPEPKIICTQKLDGVLAYLAGGHDIVAVLAFATHRDDHEAKEPIASAPVLVKRAAGMLRLVDRGRWDPAKEPWPGERSACFVSYAVGNEPLIGETPADRPLVRVARARIDVALAALAAALSPDARAFVAPIGGPASAKAVLEPAARFRFGRDRAITLDFDERAERAEEVPEGTHPVIAYTARETARELVLRGDFTGAWGAVAHLAAIDEHRAWTAVVRAVHDWQTAMPVDSAALPPRASALRALLASGRRTLHVALRVEAALRAGRIPEAVLGTAALGEAALADSLDDISRSHAADQLSVIWPGTPPEALTEVKGKSPPCLTRDETDPTRWQYRTDVACLGKIVKALSKAGVAAYHSAVQREVEVGARKLSASRLRNKAAHGRPDPELLKDARTVMNTAGLWSSSSVGERFLGQPLVVGLLHDVDVLDAAGDYERVIADVRAAIEAPLAIPERPEDR